MSVMPQRPCSSWQRTFAALNEGPRPAKGPQIHPEKLDLSRVFVGGCRGRPFTSLSEKQWKCKTKPPAS